MDGMLTEVRVDARGSHAVATQAIGDTSVTVEDPTQFAESGGSLDIAGVQYDYTDADQDAGVLTLASPLTAAVAVFDPVSVVIGGTVAQDYMAVVDLGEGHTVLVDMPYALRGWLPEQVYDPPQPVTVTDDLTTLVDAPGAALPVTMTSRALGANQTIPASTVTPLQFGPAANARFADVGCTWASSTQCTVANTGIYLVTVQVRFVASSSGGRYAYLFVNGLIVRKLGSTDAPDFVGGAMLVPLSAGDVVNLSVFQDSTTALDVIGSANQVTYFDMAMLHGMSAGDVMPGTVS